MVEHHLQKGILYKLVTSPSARFAELKPKDIDGNIFTYHLQQLIKQKLVTKHEDGSYTLTPQGKAVGINIQLKPQELLEQAHAVFLICIQNDRGEWLLRKRLAHPMYGRYGFVHGEPVAENSLDHDANLALEERTGLRADFEPIGAGYIRIFSDAGMESFTNFTMLKAINLTGELKTEAGNGANEWLSDPDFSGENMIPSMADLAKAIQDNKGFFFVDLTYHVAHETIR